MDFWKTRVALVPAGLLVKILLRWRVFTII